MNILVVNGTEVKGCTHHIKEAFLCPLRAGNTITEVTLPREMPHPCCGCKTCFLDSTDRCPHASQVNPIWDAITQADLLVFAAPVYSLGIPGALKTLLDHFCVRWMVHRPDPALFSKRAVVLTNCVGMPFMAKSAQRDVVLALSWMGVSSIRRCGIGLMEGVIWHDLSEKRRKKIEDKVRRLGEQYVAMRPAKRSLKTRLKFAMCKAMHQAVLKDEATPSADNRHWLEQGWIEAKP
jgi:multimeric flavodoxin WrbA